MKKSILLIIVFCGIFQFANAQSDTIQSDQPHEEITVNKKFDEQGNLIGYDSTYVYSWSTDSLNRSFSNQQLHKFFGFNKDFMGTDSTSSFDGFQFHDQQIQELLDRFSRMFHDPMDMNGFFSFKNDSSMMFKNDSSFVHHSDPFFQNFIHPKNDSIMQKRFGNENFFFHNDSVWKKHEKMLQKHFKEIEKMHEEFFRF